MVTAGIYAMSDYWRLKIDLFVSFCFVFPIEQYRKTAMKQTRTLNHSEYFVPCYLTINCYLFIFPNIYYFHYLCPSSLFHKHILLDDLKINCAKYS